MSAAPRSRTEEAVRLASREWALCAVHTRGEIRQLGIHGELRRLDEYAAGNRGKGLMRFIADFAAYCKRAGLPRESTARHVTSAVERVVGHAYDNDAA